MKLFDENFKYTEEALDIDTKVSRFLDSLYKEVIDKGGSPRELSAIIGTANLGSMCDACLTHGMEVGRKRTQEFIERTNPTT
jgi:hypothetical protein